MNLFVNGHFEVDTVNNFARPALSKTTAVPLIGHQVNANDYRGWWGKLISSDANLTVLAGSQLMPRLRGTAAAAKFTVQTPATTFGTLDQLQLGYCFTNLNELHATGFGGWGANAGGSVPLSIRISARSTVATVVSIALNCLSNPQTVVRNFTRNLPLAANVETRLIFDIPADANNGSWSSLWVNIGLACGSGIACPAAQGAAWNSGHYLMVDDPAVDLLSLLKTQGAEIELGKATFVHQDAPDDEDRECGPIYALRMGI